jgi:E3 ubiquitin-protein ligase HUWE1
MKILPKSKKAIPPVCLGLHLACVYHTEIILQPTQLADLIVKLLITTNEQLPTILKTLDSWKWPRSDLNSWIKVLNKFDDIMDGIIREYNVAKLQLKPFTESTKELLSEILRFERLLLENSTNRKTFNSYDVRLIPPRCILLY